MSKKKRSRAPKACTGKRKYAVVSLGDERILSCHKTLTSAKRAGVSKASKARTGQTKVMGGGKAFTCRGNEKIIKQKGYCSVS